MVAKNKRLTRLVDEANHVCFILASAARSKGSSCDSTEYRHYCWCLRASLDKKLVTICHLSGSVYQLLYQVSRLDDIGIHKVAKKRSCIPTAHSEMTSFHASCVIPFCDLDNCGPIITIAQVRQQLLDVPETT